MTLMPKSLGRQIFDAMMNTAKDNTTGTSQIARRTSRDNQVRADPTT